MASQRDPTAELLNKIVSKTPGGAATVTLGVAAFVYLLVSSLKDKSKKKGLKQVPVPQGKVPYFGHLFCLDDVPIKQFTKWHEELGPMISVWMGVKQWISVSDPYIAQLVFNVNGKFTSARPHTTFMVDYYAVGGKGIVAGSPSVQWNKTRGAMLSVISAKNRHQIEKLLNPDADAFVEKVLATTAQQGYVNVLGPLHFTSLNVILSTCFGRRTESINDPLFHEITTVMSDTGKRAGPAEEVNTFLPIMGVVDFITQKKRNMSKFIAEKRDPLFKRLIREALEGDVDCLAKSLFEMEDVNEFSNVMVTLSDAIMAGTDTSAVMLQWSFVILTRYPEVQKKIRDELDDFIRTHGRLPSFDDRESLPYSISVQKECMRFRPATFFGLPHEATEDLEINGYFIPKGATVVSNMFAIHRNEEFYPEADKFKPERFLNDIRPMYQSANSPAESRDHFNFGWGRRVCPGAYLAELEIFNIWVRLFAKCVIEPPVDASGNPVYPDMETVVNAGIVTPPAKPEVRIVKRADALI